MKIKHKLIIGIILFVVVSALLSDWKNFKAGLLGKPPVVQVQK